MNEIMAIAGSTWRRILRMRVVYFLIVCVLILIGSALRYEILSMGQHKVLMIDVALVLNTIAAILVIISVTFEIPKELREGVASTLLTKPLGRTQYLVGKLVGISITGIIICAMIALGFFIEFNFAFGEQIATSILQAHLLIICMIVPMAAIAVLFSVFMPEMITPIATAIVIWFAFSTHVIQKAMIIYGGLIPDFELFNFKSFAVYGDFIPWTYILLCLLYGLIFSVFATSLASLIFGFKDIK